MDHAVSDRMVYMPRLLHRLVFPLLALAAVLGTACSGATDIESQLELGLSLDRTSAAVGDTVVFTATAYNPTRERIQVGLECGPPLDVVLTTPSGTVVSLLTSVHGGAFTCELTEAHFADPGETERVVVAWPVVGETGVYTAVARRRCGADPGSLCMQSERETLGVH
jgi:hypothetical protein